MLSHVHIGVNDFGRAFAFYSIIMEQLGFPLKFSDPEKPWAGWKPAAAERPLFLIGRPYAIAGGGRCEGPPGLRPQYHADYYGAYFRDLDGNKICVCCHDPVSLDAISRQDNKLPETKDIG